MQTTKIIVAGGRDFDDFPFLAEKCRLIYDTTPNHKFEIVTGKAKGADTLGEKWATYNEIPIVEFPADWDKYKKAAGAIRNKEMADYADILIAFWDGKSPGTKNMIYTAVRGGLEVHVYRYTK